MDDFQTNLLRFIGASIYFSLGLQTAREMYGKSYTALGVAEKIAVDQYVMAQVGGNYNGLTEQFLKSQPAQTTGSQFPGGSQKVQ